MDAIYDINGYYGESESLTRNHVTISYSGKVVHVVSSDLSDLVQHLSVYHWWDVVRMADSTPQGLLVTAGKVHVPIKTELLNALSQDRLRLRPPHLVGILATKKEDARSYAEVRIIWLPANVSSQRKPASKSE
jgi:hypothetical protein